MNTFEQITDCVAFHAEGPCWSASWGGLRWVDMLAGDLLTMDAGGALSRLHVGSIAAFVRPRSGGGYVVGLERSIGLAENPWEVARPLTPMWENPGVRMNEGGIDPHGRLYAGSMPYDKTPGAGTLYRISPTSIEVIEAHVTTSNGIEFTADGDRAYYNDTATRYTDVYDVDEDGNLHNRRHFHDANGGSPDGLAVDSEGNVWCAINRLGIVRLYSPCAQILDQWELPCPGVTAVTLGGADRRDVFVTTSRETADVPGAGAVYHMRTSVPGQPTKFYKG